MKRLKILCFLAAAITLTLAPISTSQTQPQTVYASAVVKDYCTNIHKEGEYCSGDSGRYYNTVSSSHHRSLKSSFVKWFSDWFDIIWYTVNSWFY
ncbi:TPA: hypothetical protein TVL50_001439 [Streptococcus equi subsp. zooepidemicus]|nr:hypothetical protein [Streptococcus equi subsp. zooepidemicus]